MNPGSFNECVDFFVSHRFPPIGIMDLDLALAGAGAELWFRMEDRLG